MKTENDDGMIVRSKNPLSCPWLITLLGFAQIAMAVLLDVVERLDETILLGVLRPERDTELLHSY